MIIKGVSMLKLTTQLTDTSIVKDKPKEKTYKLYDGSGLFLLVMPVGKKRWILKYIFDAK